MLYDDKYAFGDQNLQVPAHLNFGKYLLDCLRLKKDEVALEYADTREKLTYKELTQYAVNMAIALKKLGVKQGDIVAMGSEKRNEYVPMTLGIVFIGATCNPYDIQSGRAALKHKISLTKPKYFVCSKLFWNTFSDILKSFDCIEKFVSLDDGIESVIYIKTLVTEDADVNKFEPVQVQGQTDAAFTIYTSGTTGMPKGIELSHLYCIIHSLPYEFSEESLKTAFVYGEWYHAYDMFMTYKILSLGRKVVYIKDAADQIAFLKSVQDFNVNVAFLVPSLISFLSNNKEVEKYNLDSLKLLRSTSAPIHPKALQDFKRRFPKVKLTQLYGSTEAGGLCSEGMATKGPKSGSVGMVYPGVILKVVDLETGKTVGPNQCGELRAKKPGMTKGYVGMPLSNYLDEEGFYKTGDWGYYDEDKYFFIVERLKEIITYDGYKMAPVETETILQLHPGVREAAVVGKPVPLYGEEPTAFVVKQPGVDVTEKELIDYIAEEVPPYMLLRGGVRFIEEMPRNSRGKIVRPQLKDMLK